MAKPHSLFKSRTLWILKKANQNPQHSRQLVVVARVCNRLLVVDSTDVVDRDSSNLASVE